MGDRFYKLICLIGRPPVFACTRRIVLYPERVPVRGPALIAPNHSSPYDVPLLIAAARRPIDFVTIRELTNKPMVGWFFSRMNAFPLDRSRPDPSTVRELANRAARGRLIAMFPEGRIRKPEESILTGAAINPSLPRLAALAKLPIVPCVMLGTGALSYPLKWLPIGQTVFGAAFGEPILAEGVDPKATLAELRKSYDRLYAELSEKTGLTVQSYPWPTSRFDTPQRANKVQ